MLCLIQKQLTPTQKFNELLKISSDIDRALFCPEPQIHNLNIPVFPIVNLWGQWNNCVLYTSFEEAIYVKNLFTNHTKIFYLYDLDWHINSMNYKFTLECMLSADIFLARSSYHADKIEEYCGRRPQLITEINLKEIVNGNTTVESK